MHVLRYGAEIPKPTQYIKIDIACVKIRSQYINIGNASIKIWNRVFSALCDNFRHCETFSENKVFELMFSCRPARADNYYACR